MELLKLGRSCVGDGAELHFPFLPNYPLIAQPFSHTRRCLRFARRPDKDIDHMPRASIREHRKGAALNNIQASTEKGEAVARKIAYGKSKMDLAIEPCFYRVLIRG